MKIIAVLGMPGSGKTEAISYIGQKYGWPKVYFGSVTFDELRRRGLEVNPKNEQLVREDLRNRYGEDYYAKKVIEKLEDFSDEQVVLLESLYSWTEYHTLKMRFGDDLVTLTVHASPRIRYRRLATRKERPLTEEEAKNRDIAQLRRFDQGMPIALSDFVLVNDGTMEVFCEKIDRMLSEIKFFF